MDTDQSTAHLTSVNAQVSTRAYFVEMWNRRDFAVAVPLEELRSQHKTTLLGNMWHLLNPLLTVAVYYFVFGKLLHTDRGIDNFLLLSLIHISEPTRRTPISYAVFCLKKKKNKQ